MTTDTEAKIRLLAIDLDGTLLTTDKRVTERTVQALRSAAGAGVHIVLASARPPRSVRPFYEQLGLSTPMINYNGALVYDPPGARVVMHLPIPLKTARRAVRLARALHPPVLVSAEVLDRWYTDRLDERYATETARLFAPDRVAPIDEWLTEPVTKLLLLAEAEALATVGRAIARHLPRELSLVQTEPELLQVMHGAASKAKALRCVAAELGVAREHVMAIGDNANDVGMLRWAGVGVAVGNATPEAKAAARLVTAGNDQDGVAEAVRKHVLCR